MTNIKRYIIDYVKLVIERLPDPQINTAEVKAFVLVLIGPVVALYNQLLTYRNFLKYKISITPQVCYLEKMLNDQYDNALRRIYIRDGSQFTTLHLFLEGEDLPIFIFTEAEVAAQVTFLFTEGESSNDGSFDFVVFYPAGLSFEMNEMISLIRNYKLASKIFSIQPF
jgi:hypothetical protein